jgi:hypothetical protein
VSWPSDTSFSVWISRFCAYADRREIRQFAGTGRHLFEQLRVLDGDCRLVRERYEGTRFACVSAQYANRQILVQYRNIEQRTKIAEPLPLLKL